MTLRTALSSDDAQQCLHFALLQYSLVPCFNFEIYKVLSFAQSRTQSMSSNPYNQNNQSADGPTNLPINMLSPNASNATSPNALVSRSTADTFYFTNAILTNCSRHPFYLKQAFQPSTWPNDDEMVFCPSFCSDEYLQ